MSFVGEAVLCGVTARRRVQVAGQPAFFCFWSDNRQTLCLDGVKKVGEKVTSVTVALFVYL